MVAKTLKKSDEADDRLKHTENVSRFLKTFSNKDTKEQGCLQKSSFW